MLVSAGIGEGHPAADLDLIARGRRGDQLRTLDPLEQVAQVALEFRQALLVRLLAAGLFLGQSLDARRHTLLQLLQTLGGDIVGLGAAAPLDRRVYLVGGPILVDECSAHGGDSCSGVDA
ncbi:hypothetical protein D3C78_1391980 [compost metagenome]